MVEEIFYIPEAEDQFQKRVDEHNAFIDNLVKVFKVPYNIHRKWHVGKRKKNIRSKTIHYLKNKKICLDY